MMKRVAITIFCFCCTSSAWAQTSIGGSIRGIIADEQGAVLPGVVLTATSPDVPGTYRAASDETGYYRLLELPPGEYSIAAELPGFAKFIRDNITIRAGLNLGINIVMKLGTVTEVVTVNLETPILESRNAAQALNISGEFQRALPLSYRRDWADYLSITPGVVSSSGSSFTNYFVHGATDSSQALLVDGADLGSALSGSTFFVQLPSETLNDVQIKTAGVDASSPLGLGAVINLATRSGTNRLQGAANGVFQPKRWNGSNVPDGVSTSVALRQLELSGGGPLRPNAAWFFGSYRHTHSIEGLSRTATQLTALRTLVPAFEPFDNESHPHFYFAKITAQLSPTNQLLSFIQYDRTRRGNNSGLFAEPLSSTESGGSAYALRLSSVVGSSTTLRVTASYNNKGSAVSRAYHDRPARNVYDSVVRVSGRPVGGGIAAIVNNGLSSNFGRTDKITVAVDATYLRQGWLGSHEIQTGLYLQPTLRTRLTQIWPRDGFALEDVVLKNPLDASQGVTPFHRRIYDGTEAPLKFVDGSDYAVYLQDSWRAGNRLTVNAGVRLDVIVQTDTVFGVSTQNSVDVGPRFGVNYLITKDAFNVLRAGWSRVHDTPSNTSFSVGSSTLGFRDLYDSDLDGTFETVFVTPGATALNPSLRFDSDSYHQPYISEWTFGYRRQLRGQLSIDAGWLRREFRERTTGLEINGIYDGGVFSGFRNESLNEIYLLTNNTWNWPVYSAFELQVAKRSQRVQAVAGYTRNWRHLAGTWQPNDPAAFIQPEAFANARGIGPTKGLVPGDSNSLSGSQGAAVSLSEWHDHAFRGGVAYSAPWNLIVATNYTFQSGAWSGPVVTRVAEPDPRFGPLSLRLSNGRIVPNPLATTIRFVGSTRSDGQVRLPNLHVWNLRIGRKFDFRRRRLETSVDVFNLLNHGADQWFLSGGNQFYSANYGKGTMRQLPRAVQVSSRFVF